MAAGGGLVVSPDIARTLMSHGGNDKHDPSLMTYIAHQGGTQVATWDERNVTSATNRSSVEYGAPSNTLHADPLSIIGTAGVRRLTPLECERLQGFPDGFTAGQSDSTRYRQLGNAVAVPVCEWIGKRIAEFVPQTTTQTNNGGSL